MTQALRSAAALAPAKINLALHVTGRRPDGYHLIESLVVFADCGDRVSLNAAERDGFIVNGPQAKGIPADGTNLVLKARDALRAAFPAGCCPPVEIVLDKMLPPAAGIGGGSSDAATTLKLLCSHWRRDVAPDELAALALALGADVPMCLAARPLVARGIGEEIAPLAGWPRLDIVLVNPGVAVSTAAVFTALASPDNAPLPPLPAQPGGEGLAAWLAATRNDLEAPARRIAPAISEALAALDEAGAGFSRMSGSGATCFGLFSSRAEAERAAPAIAAARPGWFVRAASTLQGDGT